MMPTLRQRAFPVERFSWIQVYPTYRCNNHCTFCSQKPIRGVVADKLEVATIKRVGAELEFFFKQRAGKSLIMDFLGGEMFDRLTPEHIDAYNSVVNNIIAFAKGHHVTVHLNILTNLLYPKENLYRFLEIFDRLKDAGVGDYSITSSFDLRGRFHTPEALARWRDNLAAVIPLVELPSINFVLDKSFLKILQERNTELSEIDAFEWLYSLALDGKISLEHLRFYNVGDADDDREMLTDKEYAQAVIWLIENYPAAIPIENNPILFAGDCCDGGHGSVTPTGGVQVNHCANLTVMSCKSLSPEIPLDDALKENSMCLRKVEDAYNSDYILQSMVRYYGCLTCRHYQRCQLDCHKFWNIKKNHADPTSHYCWLREVNDYLVEKGLLDAAA